MYDLANFCSYGGIGSEQEYEGAVRGAVYIKTPSLGCSITIYNMTFLRLHRGDGIPTKAAHDCSWTAIDEKPR